MIAPVSLSATLLVGFALGLRHALDTDHVVAVSTLVAREKSVWKSSRIGAAWGLGHTATLFLMGAAILALGLRIPPSVAPLLETAVAFMLIFLGVRTLWQWKRGEGHFCTHEHGQGYSHTHFHTQGEHECEVKTIPLKSAGTVKQPFLVGAVHGLSGSAELMLLVLATIRHPLWALVYIAVFGLGMMVAMFFMTTLFSLALGFAARFKGAGWSRIDSGMRALTGAASLGFGAYLLLHFL